MPDKLENYKRGNPPLPPRYRLWPLYGAGFENLGRDGEPIEVPMPAFGPDELLVRHDAVGLCFSDVKVIRAGAGHPRIYRDMSENPVVLGHEVTLTVVGVGANLARQFSVGDRFIVQADIYIGGVGYAYGYEIQGGLSQYSVIDQRVLDADDGNHLIPVEPSMGYAESALTEPWTCVNTAYRLRYRTGLKPGGTAWIIGSSASQAEKYTLTRGFGARGHPRKVLLSAVPREFSDWIRRRADKLGAQVVDVADVASPPVDEVDDIILLKPDAGLIEAVSPRVAPFGILAIVSDVALERDINVDVGRVHYNRWLYVGGTGPDISNAYADVPVRPTLKPGGRAWFVGAGGPMGQMHVARAVQADDGPAIIFCTARSDRRLKVVESLYAADAKAKGIEFVCISLKDEISYRETLENVGNQGFDDIMVMAPDANAISDAAKYIAPRGVMNIFAGVPRGTMAKLDLNDVVQRRVRFIGHSGLTTEDMQITLDMVQSGALSPERLVVAIGSLRAAREGLKGVGEAVFPGKVVIYPHISDFPQTFLSDLEDVLPSVYAKLRNGSQWTIEAEDEFLRLMLP
jgi:threonine dehydrogenase-like Zn-dependent dehydrogenase